MHTINGWTNLDGPRNLVLLFVAILSFYFSLLWWNSTLTTILWLSELGGTILFNFTPEQARKLSLLYTFWTIIIKQYTCVTHSGSTTICCYSKSLRNQCASQYLYAAFIRLIKFQCAFTIAQDYYSVGFLIHKNYIVFILWISKRKKCWSHYFLIFTRESIRILGTIDNYQYCMWNKLFGRKF